MTHNETTKLILNQKNGTIKELTDTIGEEEVNSLILTGKIQLFENINKVQTWRVSVKFFNYSQEENFKENLMQKIHNFINFRLFKKITTI